MGRLIPAGTGFAAYQAGYDRGGSVRGRRGRRRGDALIAEIVDRRPASAAASIRSGGPKGALMSLAPNQEPMPTINRPCERDARRSRTRPRHPH